MMINKIDGKINLYVENFSSSNRMMRKSNNQSDLIVKKHNTQHDENFKSYLVVNQIPTESVMS